MRHAGPVNVGDERRRFRILPPQVLESLPYDLEPLHSRAPQLITQIAVEIQNTCNFLTVEVWAEIHGSQSLAGSPVLELLMKAAPQRERNQGYPECPPGRGGPTDGEETCTQRRRDAGRRDGLQ